MASTNAAARSRNSYQQLREGRMPKPNHQSAQCSCASCHHRVGLVAPVGIEEDNGQHQIGSMWRLAAASIGVIERCQIKLHGSANLPRQMVGGSRASSWRQGADCSFQGGAAKRVPALVSCKVLSTISLASSGCAEYNRGLSHLHKTPKTRRPFHFSICLQPSSENRTLCKGGGFE